MQITVRVFTGEILTGSPVELVEKLRNTSRDPRDNIQEFMEAWAFRAKEYFRVTLSTENPDRFIESGIREGIFIKMGLAN